MIRRSRGEIGVDLFTGAVILSVALALAGLSWRIAGDSGLSARAPVAAATPPPPPVDVAAIVAASPFGTAAALPVDAGASGLTLRALMFAHPAGASTALISAGDAPAMLLHIGDPAPGGAIVDGIAIDHVLLRTAGGLQKLEFPKPGAGAAGAGQPGGSSPPPIALPAPAGPTAMPSAPLMLPPPGHGGGAGIAPTFLDSMGATATDGGYRIGTNASAAMRQAGLQPGDLVQKVNGTVVGNVDGDRMLFAAAAGGAPLNVEILRNGRRITISLPAR
jgi:general secretion pathway protein C